MRERDDAGCVSCGAPAEGCGLPVDDAGEIVGTDFVGEWAGAAACRGCHDFHAAHGPAALGAHVRALGALQALVGRVHEVWSRHAEDAEEWALLRHTRPFARHAAAWREP